MNTYNIGDIIRVRNLRWVEPEPGNDVYHKVFLDTLVRVTDRWGEGELDVRLLSSVDYPKVIREADEISQLYVLPRDAKPTTPLPAPTGRRHIMAEFVDLS